jgi:hypothetical protein
MEDWRNLGRVRGQEILIDHVLIHEQLGISREGVVDVVNATFEEAKTTFQRIVGPHVFVENEQWSVMLMKEEFHARFFNYYDALPSSLIDSNVSQKWKQRKSKELGDVP